VSDLGDPNGIRTRVTPVKGECPRPLDDRVIQGDAEYGKNPRGRKWNLQGAIIQWHRLLEAAARMLELSHIGKASLP
jgi:hypothetical protein